VIAQSVRRWATCRTIGILGFDSRRGLGIFLFTTASRTALEPTQPPIQCVPGALSLELKRPGREVDHHTSIYCRGQRMSGTIPPLHQHAFMARCSVKAQGQIYLFTFTDNCDNSQPVADLRTWILENLSRCLLDVSQFLSPFKHTPRMSLVYDIYMYLYPERLSYKCKHNDVKVEGPMQESWYKIYHVFVNGFKTVD
jgi:hypothetical protein